MEIKKDSTNLIRVVLGLLLVVYALNQFLHFLPTSYGKMPENTKEFINAVSNYLPYLYILEILIGLFLIFNKWTSFILIVLFPLSISFLIFNIANDNILKSLPAFIVAVLNIYLIVIKKEVYKPLFH